jgi:hypothetical protein
MEEQILCIYRISRKLQTAVLSKSLVIGNQQDLLDGIGKGVMGKRYGGMEVWQNKINQIKTNKIKRSGAPQFNRAISGKLADYGGVRMGLGELWTGVA